MKNVLVTGSYGQLGTELNFLSSLLEAHSFNFVDRDDLDITDETAVGTFFFKNQYSVLINCAAYTAVDKAESEKDIAFKINADGVGVLAKICLQHNCKFVHISTDFIFDGTNSFPIKENEKPKPLSVYGASKLAGEELAFAANPETLLIRTSWVYSSFGNNFVKTILKLIVIKKV